MHRCRCSPAAATALAGCNLAPKYVQPGGCRSCDAAAGRRLSGRDDRCAVASTAIGWRDFFVDPALRDDDRAWHWTTTATCGWRLRTCSRRARTTASSAPTCCRPSLPAPTRPSPTTRLRRGRRGRCRLPAAASSPGRSEISKSIRPTRPLGIRDRPVRPRPQPDPGSAGAIFRDRGGAARRARSA